MASCLARRERGGTYEFSGDVVGMEDEKEKKWKKRRLRKKREKQVREVVQGSSSGAASRFPVGSC